MPLRLLLGRAHPCPVSRLHPRLDTAPARNPVEVITRSTFNVIADYTVSGHHSGRGGAGVSAFDCFAELPSVVPGLPRSGWGDAPVFARSGKAMTRHGLAHRPGRHAATARNRMPPMASERIVPHLPRHGCAARTLEATGDIRKVSLWLGHAGIQSTGIDLRSDPAGKRDVLSARRPPAIGKGSFKLKLAQRA